MHPIQRTRLATALLAALAAGGASAQSSTTLYGIFDVGVEYTNHVGAAKNTLVRMPGLTGSFPSRIGFRGTEDLGGGLRAAYTLETGFAPDTGVLNQGGRFVGRQAWIGLQGSWGQVLFGRQYTMLFWGTIDSDTMGPSAFASGSIDSYLPNARVDNAVGYRGTFGPVSLGATYSLGRDAVNAGPSPSGTNCPGELATDKTACREWSAMVKYDGGPFGVILATDRFHGGTGAFAGLTSSALTDQRTTLNGYFKIGDSKVTAGVIRRNNQGSATAPKTDLWWVGGTYVASPALSFDAQVFRLNTKANSNDATMPVVRATYAFSKRTATYVQAAYVKNSGASTISVSGAAPGSAPAPGENQTGLFVGLRHSF